jgi:hypothetical protein
VAANNRSGVSGIPEFNLKASPSVDRGLWLGIALIMLLALLMRALPGPRTIDDAFITFRYSRNILDGNGFVYNLGSRVMGTTTPLYTLLMALIGAVLNGRDFPAYAIVVSALADAVTAALLVLLMWRTFHSRWPALLLGALWAIAPMSVTFAVGGMETSVVILWIVAAMAAYIADQPILVGIFAALGILTRIDSLLWAGPLLLHQAVLRLWPLRHGLAIRRLVAALPWRTWIAFGVVLLPWLVFSLAYFGTIIPRSVTAKTAVYIMPPGTALTTTIQNYITPFFENDTFGPIGAMVGFVVYILLYAAGGVFAVRRNGRLLPWMIYPFLYAAAFAIANPLIFRWYMAPPMPALFFMAVGGVWGLVRGARLRPQARITVQRIGLGAAAVFWIGTSLNAWTLHPDHGLDRPAPQMAWHKVELFYRDMADTLTQKYGVNAQSRIAVADIGVVGYFTNAVIIDTVGLISPSMSKYYPADPALIIPGQNYAVPPAIIHDTKPEYVVLMEAAVRFGLARDPQFNADYETVRTIPTDFYGTGMILYRRLTPR